MPHEIRTGREAAQILEPASQRTWERPFGKSIQRHGPLAQSRLGKGVVEVVGVAQTHEPVVADLRLVDEHAEGAGGVERGLSVEEIEIQGWGSQGRVEGIVEDDLFDLCAEFCGVGTDEGVGIVVGSEGGDKEGCAFEVADGGWKD